MPKVPKIQQSQERAEHELLNSFINFASSAEITPENLIEAWEMWDQYEYFTTFNPDLEVGSEQQNSVDVEMTRLFQTLRKELDEEYYGKNRNKENKPDELNHDKRIRPSKAVLYAQTYRLLQEVINVYIPYDDLELEERIKRTSISRFASAMIAVASYPPLIRRIGTDIQPPDEEFNNGTKANAKVLSMIQSMVESSYIKDMIQENQPSPLPEKALNPSDYTPAVTYYAPFPELRGKLDLRFLIRDPEDRDQSIGIYLENVTLIQVDFESEQLRIWRFNESSPTILRFSSISSFTCNRFFKTPRSDVVTD